MLSVVDEYAYIPSYWRVDGQVCPPPEAVPTSYYSSVQLRCRVELVDEAEAKAELLAAQLRHFQPEGEIVAPSADGPHARFLAGIRGVKLHVVEARAKFKYDDQKPAGLQSSVNAHLHDRSSGHDLAVAEQQARRMAARGVGP